MLRHYLPCLLASASLLFPCWTPSPARAQAQKPLWEAGAGEQLALSPLNFPKKGDFGKA